MYKPKKTTATIIVVLLAFIALGSVYYSFNEARKLASDRAVQNQSEADLKIAKDNFDLENKRLKEIRAKSYLMKISREQYTKTKKLVDQTNVFFKDADSLHPEIILKTGNRTTETEINAKRLKINLLLQDWDNNEDSIETNQEIIDKIKTVILFVQSYMSQLQTIVYDLPTNSDGLTNEDINAYHQIINSGITQITEVMNIINQTESIINDPTNPLNSDSQEIAEQIEVIHRAEDRVTELENINNEANNQNPNASTTNSIVNTDTASSTRNSTSSPTTRRPRIVNPEPMIIYQINPAPHRDTGVDLDKSGNLDSVQDW
jgi:hypothetical protein